MSALGQKRTNLRRLKPTFVRYCPKADNRKHGVIVRFVPEADIHLSPVMATGFISATPEVAAATIFPLERAGS